MQFLAICRAFGGFLYGYWRPIAVLILLLTVWLHGHHSGASGERAKWELIAAKQMSVQAQAMFKNSEHARKVEQDWSAAFDAAATISHEELSHVLFKTNSKLLEFG